MNTRNNLVLKFPTESQIVHMDSVTAKEKFNKFYASFLSSSWDNKIVSASNFISLPVAECMKNGDLKLLSGTNGLLLGHDTLKSFVTSSDKDYGLGMEWGVWLHNIDAMLKKIQFGINSTSPDDVLLQIEDVTSILGRSPVSKFEFNLAKDQIVREQVEKIQIDHHQVVTEMKGKIASLMHQLDDERSEKLHTIERLESALNELSSIKDAKVTVDLKDYVERSLYESIVSEMDEIKDYHESLFQDYLDKVAKLSSSNKDLLNKISILQSMIQSRNDEIKSLSSLTQENLSVSSQDNEIALLKKKVVELLKKNIHKQKVINKQKVVSKKKSDINSILRVHNERLKSRCGSDSSQLSLKSKDTHKGSFISRIIHRMTFR